MKVNLDLQTKGSMFIHFPFQLLCVFAWSQGRLRVLPPVASEGLDPKPKHVSYHPGGVEPASSIGML